MEKSHKSRRTIARVLHELREAGLLGIAVSGTTPQFSPMALADVEHNIASIYVLAKPATLELLPDVHNSVDELGTQRLLSVGKKPLRVRARKTPFTNRYAIDFLVALRALTMTYSHGVQVACGLVM